MRIVIFDNAGNWPMAVYPEEGIDAFGLTYRDGDDIFGQYFGAQTDPTLPDYGGAWPVPQPAPLPVVLKSIAAWQLFDPNVGFTAAEYAAISGSGNVDVIAALHSLEIANMVNLPSPEVAALFQIFVDNAVLTSNRRDDLEAGVII